MTTQRSNGSAAEQGHASAPFLFNLSPVKPQAVTQMVRIPNGGSYDDRIQSATYAQYDSSGRIVYSVVAEKWVPAAGGNPGHFLASGNNVSYTSGPDDAPGLPRETRGVTTWIEPDGSGGFQLTNITHYAETQKNAYYQAGHVTIPGVQEGVPGAVYGALRSSIDAAGQQTYYAYDSVGRKVLEYVYRQWTDPSGGRASSGLRGCEMDGRIGWNVPFLVDKAFMTTENSAIACLRDGISLGVGLWEGYPTIASGGGP